MNLWLWYVIIGIVMAIVRYEITGDDVEAFVFGIAWPFGILCLLVGWFIDRSKKKEELPKPVEVFKKNRKVHYCSENPGEECYWFGTGVCMTKAVELQITNYKTLVTCSKCMKLLGLN